MSQVQIKHYVFNRDEVLGKGSTGTVYLGLDTRNNRKVAVKVIELKNITNQVTKYLLENQVKALQVTNHPNVLKAYDVVYDSDCCYVVTNYCPNNTLQHYIKSRGRIPEDEAIKIFKAIVDGYLNLQVNKILHRDLKPSNILFSENFEPVICDFGYCQISGFLPKPKLHYNVGSPAYMAPQSITKNMYSQSSQVWSLGTILYEMLQGKSFAHGKEVMEAIMQIKKRGPYSPDGSSQYSKKIIRQCMALHPNERMRLKDLMNILRSGQFSNPVSSRPTYQPKNIPEMRPATHSITNVSNNEHDLQNLHLAQQQLQQQQLQLQQQQQLQQQLLQPIVNQSFNRRTVPVARQDTYKQTTRNTLPVQLTNVTRARSTQPLTPQQLASQLPFNRLSTLPEQSLKRQHTMLNQHLTHSLQPQVVLNHQEATRPSTTRLPFRPPSNFLTLDQSFQNPILGGSRDVPQMVDRTFINPQDFLDHQLIHNTSFRSQPSHTAKIEERNVVSSLPTGGSSAFGRQVVMNQSGNTIRSINATLLNHQGSVRRINEQPLVLVSKRSNSSHIPQEEFQYQSGDQRAEFIRRIAQQQGEQIRQVSVHNPQIHQIQQIQEARRIQQQLPQYQQIQQIQQSHLSPQSPFLKTAASKIYTPTSEFPPTQESRFQKIQMTHPNLLPKRKHPSNIPQGILTSQFQPKQVQFQAKELPQRIINNGYPPLQRPISIGNRRLQ